jgi:hypothetical protein
MGNLGYEIIFSALGKVFLTGGGYSGCALVGLCCRPRKESELKAIWLCVKSRYNYTAIHQLNPPYF